MVGWKVHYNLCCNLLGWGYRWVHQDMDSAYKSLVGKHRDVAHDFNSLFDYAILTNDVNVCLAGFIHLWQDNDLYEAVFRSYGNGEKLFTWISDTLFNVESETDLKKILKDRNFILPIENYLNKERDEALSYLEKAGIIGKGITINPNETGKRFQKKLNRTTFPLKDYCTLCGNTFRYNPGSLNKLVNSLGALKAKSIWFHQGLIKEGKLLSIGRRPESFIGGEVSVISLCPSCLKKYSNQPLIYLLAHLAIYYPRFKETWLPSRYWRISLKNKRCPKCRSNMGGKEYLDNRWIHWLCPSCSYEYDRKIDLLENDFSKYWDIQRIVHYYGDEPDYRWVNEYVAGFPLYHLLKIMKEKELNEVIKIMKNAWFNDAEFQVIYDLSKEISFTSHEEFLKDYYFNNQVLPQSIKYYWSYSRF